MMTKRMRQQSRPSVITVLWNAKSGIAALEFALYTPWILLLLFTAVSYGAGLRMKMEVGNAARAGATYASSHATFDENAIKAVANNATTIAQVNPAVTKSPASCPDRASGTVAGVAGGTNCPLTGTPPGYYVTVTTNVDYTFIFTPPGMPATTKLNGKAVARIP